MALPSMIAVCSGQSPAVGIAALALLGGLAFLGVITAIVWSGKGEAWRLTGVYVATLIGGIVAVSLLLALGDGGYAWMLSMTAVLGGVFGIVVGVRRGRMLGRYAVLGVLGGGTWLPSFLLLIILVLSVGGACLD